MAKAAAGLRVGIVLYEGWEPLDVSGPIELFSYTDGIDKQFVYVAERANTPYGSYVGNMQLLSTAAFNDCPEVRCELRCS